MDLLIYSTDTEGATQRLLRVIELLLPESKFEVFRSIGDFSKRLRQSIFNRTIAILFASCPGDIHDILAIRDLLSDTKIILIVSDMNPDTLAKGHTLRPRFLSHCDSDFVDVAAVLKRMVSNLREDMYVCNWKSRGNSRHYLFLRRN